MPNLFADCVGNIVVMEFFTVRLHFVKHGFWKLLQAGLCWQWFRGMVLYLCGPALLWQYCIPHIPASWSGTQAILVIMVQYPGHLGSLPMTHCTRFPFFILSPSPSRLFLSSTIGDTQKFDLLTKTWANITSFMSPPPRYDFVSGVVNMNGTRSWIITHGKMFGMGFGRWSDWGWRGGGGDVKGEW